MMRGEGLREGERRTRMPVISERPKRKKGDNYPQIRDVPREQVLITLEGKRGGQARA